MSRRRLDAELVARGLAGNLEDAKEKIDLKQVLVDGSVALKPSALVLPGSSIEISSGTRRSSRAGEKLANALETLHLDIKDKVCLDAGAGHGGFTQELIHRGAREVVAVDVGYGQIDLELRNDSRVRLLERTNLRIVPLEILGGPFGFITADLSFISITAVMARLSSVLEQNGDMLVLVKPQFEVPASDVPPGGVVSDPGLWEEALSLVARSVEGDGLGMCAVVPSQPRGVKGNQEFFIWARPGVGADSTELIRRAIWS